MAVIPLSEPFLQRATLARRLPGAHSSVMDGNTSALELFDPGTFRPRWPWRGADLQTVRNFVVRPAPSFADRPGTEIWFPMSDGTGDRLHGWLHETSSSANRPRPAPLIVIIHGLTGCSESYHVLLSARHLIDAGFDVLRLNLRAAGPTVPVCSEQYLAGRSEDLRQVFEQLGTDRPLACVGYSLGANMLLKYLGEAGTEALTTAAVAVSPPVDLAATSVRFHRRRNLLYRRYLLSRMVDDVFRMREPPAPQFAERLRRVSTVYDFDDQFIAPRYGFRSADHYYEAHSALGFLDAIRVPTLIMHADDDPWIPAQSLRHYDWKSNRHLFPALTERGGHVGFHAAGLEMPWHDLVLTNFLKNIMKS